MRISDWSSDVCSSDLHARGPLLARRHERRLHPRRLPAQPGPGRRARRAAGPDRPADGLRRAAGGPGGPAGRSEEHTSELQSLMRISYAVFCLKKKKKKKQKKSITMK